MKQFNFICIEGIIIEVISQNREYILENKRLELVQRIPILTKNSLEIGQKVLVSGNLENMKIIATEINIFKNS